MVRLRMVGSTLTMLLCRSMSSAVSKHPCEKVHMYDVTRRNTYASSQRPIENLAGDGDEVHHKQRTPILFSLSVRLTVGYNTAENSLFFQIIWKLQHSSNLPLAFRVLKNTDFCPLQVFDRQLDVCWSYCASGDAEHWHMAACSLLERDWKRQSEDSLSPSYSNHTAFLTC